MKKTISKIILIIILLSAAIILLKNIVSAAPARSGDILAKDSRWSSIY